MKFKVGDKVIITAGKDKGKTSEIIRLFPKKDKVLVKDVNMYKRHVKAREGLEGGIISLERPMSTAKIAVIDPVTKKPTRIGYNTESTGIKLRIAKKSGSDLDKKPEPKKAKSTKKVTKKD